MMARRPASRDRKRGFALIVVVWFLVLLAAIGTYIMANARSETALARNILEGAKVEALADAGIAQAVFNLTDPIPNQRWKLDGAPHSLSLLGGEVTIQLNDEAAKINPNIASEELMAGLFETLGVDRAHARRLGAGIADWVDGDNNPRPSGAEKDEYRAAGKSYGPPNAPIETLDELHLVLGMTPEILAAARPYLTIHTQAEAPDPKAATPVVQQALAIAAQVAALSDQSGQSDPAANDQGASDQGTESPPGASSSSASGAAPAPAAPGTAAKSDAVIADVAVTARYPGRGEFVRRAIVEIDADDPKGYLVLDWRRSDLAD